MESGTCNPQCSHFSAEGLLEVSVLRSEGVNESCLQQAKAAEEEAASAVALRGSSAWGCRSPRNPLSVLRLCVLVRVLQRNGALRT